MNHHTFDTSSILLRDGENRLRGISDNGYMSLYWYDADGNRTVKEHLGGEAAWVNSAQAGQRTDATACSIYPNAYISISGNRWTKHYYIGSERIASRTGTITSFNSLSTPDNKVAGYGLSGVSVNYGAMCGALEDSVASVYAQFGVPYEAHRTSNRGDAYHLYLPIGRTEEKDKDAAESSDNNQQRNHPNTLGDGKVYFYHRDHLGSTMSVTDSVGNYTQIVEYTPWGEVFVEQRNDSICTTPYLFNGKELDEETGLYYYGARYYNPKMSVWFSVDPLEEKYKDISPYVYCHNNPISKYDINGFADFFTINGKFISSDKNDKDPFIYINTNGKNIRLSDYKFDKSNSRAMMRIVYHYAEAIGASTNGRIIGVDFGNKKHLDGSVLAYSLEDKIIRVLAEDGHFNKELAQIYNMKCTISHEKFHTEISETPEEEVLVLINEMKMPEFKKTTDFFKSGTIGYLQNSLIDLYPSRRAYKRVINEALNIVSKYGIKLKPIYDEGGNKVSFISYNE